MASKSTRSRPGLRALDPDLPLLASEAAIDIDNMLGGGVRRWSAIGRLAALFNTVNLTLEKSQRLSRLDPGTLTVLSEAVTSARGNGTFQQLTDFFHDTAEIFNIFNSLKSLDPQEDRGKFELARSFCLALSREALAYSVSIQDWPTPHPYRA